MEPIVAKRQADSAPIPVIGIELGHEMQNWLDAEAEIMKKSRGEKIK